MALGKGCMADSMAMGTGLAGIGCQKGNPRNCQTGRRLLIYQTGRCRKMGRSFLICQTGRRRKMEQSCRKCRMGRHQRAEPCNTAKFSENMLQMGATTHLQHLKISLAIHKSRLMEGLPQIPP